MIYLIDPKAAVSGDCKIVCPLFDLPKPLYGIPW